jgi:hypothetical protein
MALQRPEHFQLYELVDRATFQKWGDNAWTLLNPNALEALEGIRNFFDSPVMVNNWYGGGPFQYRGYRGPECQIGAPLSQHRRGNAFDCDIKGLSASEAREIILANQDDPRLSKITRLEADVTWLHFDCGEVPKGKNRIYVFKG